MAEDHARFLDIISRLQSCQADLSRPSDAETVQLLSIAILQMRMRLGRVSDDEFKLLSDSVPTPAPALKQTTALSELA